MKIAVAGSDGFVGKNVCKQLENAGHEVIRIDISQILKMKQLQCPMARLLSKLRKYI